MPFIWLYTERVVLTCLIYHFSSVIIIFLTNIIINFLSIEDIKLAIFSTCHYIFLMSLYVKFTVWHNLLILMKKPIINFNEDLSKIG